jgi:hypothetical protein
MQWSVWSASRRWRAGDDAADNNEDDAGRGGGSETPRVRQKSSFAKSKEETSLKLMMDDYYLGSPAYCYCYSLNVKKRMAVIFGGDVSLSLSSSSSCGAF